MTRTEWIRTAWGITSNSGRIARPLHFLNWWLFANRWRWLYRLARRLEGARSVPTGRIGRDVDDVSGTYTRHGYSTPEDRWEMARVEFSGACPVQGEGHVFGYPCYYRSRGEGWQFHVAATKDGDPLDDGAWFYGERCYIFPEGGWVRDHVSMSCIGQAVDAWIKWRSRKMALLQAKELVEGLAITYERLAEDYAGTDYSPAIETDRLYRHD